MASATGVIDAPGIFTASEVATEAVAAAGVAATVTGVPGMVATAAVEADSAPSRAVLIIMGSERSTELLT
jgi:hypothetical protein